MAAGQAWSWVAAVSLALGECEGLARLAMQLALFRGCLMTGGLIDRLLGELALAQGDLGAAERFLAASEAVARREGHHWELAQVLAAHADLLLALGGSGRGEQARELLRAAQGHYRHVGNAVEAGALDARLRRLGERLSLPAGLSPREAEVLRAVAAGKSNRVIAEKLMLSRRTVENHLANIYAKIGADNRAGAVAFALAPSRTAAAACARPMPRSQAQVVPQRRARPGAQSNTTVRQGDAGSKGVSPRAEGGPGKSAASRAPRRGPWAR